MYYFICAKRSAGMKIHQAKLNFSDLYGHSDYKSYVSINVNQHGVLRNPSGSMILRTSLFAWISIFGNVKDQIVRLEINFVRPLGVNLAFLQKIKSRSKCCEITRSNNF